MRPARPVLRFHGGKFRLASWLLEVFPAHTCYVEPFGGAASVLLRKAPCHAEVYNDIDGEVVNFFRVLRDVVQREALIERLVLTPFARAEFDLAYEPSSDPVESAARLCVRSWMGYGSAGAHKSTTGFRLSAKDVLLWSRFPDVIGGIGTRLEGVLLENRPAASVMLHHDGPNTLHYVDPPYVFATRNRASKHAHHRYYRNEMSDWEHISLLTCLKNLTGMVVLSGYYSDLYAQHLTGWHMRTTRTYSGSAGIVSPRTEVVWINESCLQRLSAAVAHGCIRQDAVLLPKQASL